MVRLLCLFTGEPELDYTLGMIQKTYQVVYKRIFVLSIIDSDELVCSFNVDKNVNQKQLPAAMLVHRKKETNTLYTLNAMNKLIAEIGRAHV